MPCYLGEIIRWNRGDAYALVKPTHLVEDRSMRALTPREVDKAFPISGKAHWYEPSERCQVGRMVIFSEFLASSQSHTNEAQRVMPISPSIVLRLAARAGDRPMTLAENLARMTTLLNGSSTYRLGQDFKVYLRHNATTLHYFGPFTQEDSNFKPPQNIGTVKVSRVAAGELPTVFIDDLGLEILGPQAQLVKVAQSAADIPYISNLVEADPTPAQKSSVVILPSMEQQLAAIQTQISRPVSLSEALEKLGKALPLHSWRKDLKILAETLPKAPSLNEEERALLREALLEGLDLGDEVHSLLPILHEHGAFSDYFEDELLKHKRNIEAKIQNEADKRLQDAREEVSRRETRLAAERKAFKQEQEQIAETIANQEALVAKLEAELRILQENQIQGTQDPPPMVTPSASPTTQHGSRPMGVAIGVAAAQEILQEFQPLARLQVAFGLSRVPLLCGPRSLRLARHYAQTICGGMLRWSSVDPLLTQARSLLGTFKDGLFEPHPSGIATLVLQAQTSPCPGLVVLEGANRAPLELLLEPLLLSRDAGVPLFPVEAFRPDDPFSGLGGLPWPEHLLIACTLTTGVAKQPISPVLWDRLMVVDESGWPTRMALKETSYVPVEQFSLLVKPVTNPEARMAIQEFKEEVEEAIWVTPGAQTLIHQFEGFDQLDALAETRILLLASGSLCAGANLKGLEPSLEEKEFSRLRLLQPFLV